MGCGTSTMFKEKKSEKCQKFTEYNEGNYYNLQDALQSNQGGSVIDLTIKKSATRSKNPSREHNRNHIVSNTSSSTTDTDLSSRNADHASDIEEYDELPPRRFMDDYDIPPSRSINKDLTPQMESEDYDIPRSKYQLSPSSSHDEYDFPRSCQYHADVSFYQ